MAVTGSGWSQMGALAVVTATSRWELACCRIEPGAMMVVEGQSGRRGESGEYCTVLWHRTSREWLLYGRSHGQVTTVNEVVTCEQYALSTVIEGSGGGDWECNRRDCC